MDDIDPPESNVSLEPFIVRTRVPVLTLSQVEALSLSASVLPFSQEHVSTDQKLSGRAFAFRVEHPSPACPDFRVTDLLVGDPMLSPQDTDFVLCRSPIEICRYTSELAERVIGVLVEHRAVISTKAITKG